MGGGGGCGQYQNQQVCRMGVKRVRNNLVTVLVNFRSHENIFQLEEADYFLDKNSICITEMRFCFKVKR